MDGNVVSDTVFGDEVVEWKGLQWIKRPVWGYTHPDYEPSWFDTTLPYIDENGSIVLGVDDKEAEFIAENGEVMQRRWATSLVRTLPEFKYGTYEFEMMCPKGNNLWAALWLASDNTWPPEIDIMEGWSGNDGLYKASFLKFCIFPTLHWVRDGEHIAKRGNDTCICKLRVTEDFDKYKLEWMENRITLWYNGKKVFTCKDKNILRGFNNASDTMHVKLQLNVDEGFCEEDFKDYVKNGHPMIVKDFKFQEL